MAAKKPKKSKFNLNPKFAKKLIIIILVGTISFLLAKKYRSQFVVAIVNYTPISRSQLNKTLNERYGETVLNELINQALIKDILKKNKIEVTQKEIEQEINRLKTQMGGDEVFQETLAQYGLTLDQLKDRFIITLGQKKLAQTLFSPEITDEEAADYFTQNKAIFKDKTLEDAKEEIKTNLLDQKLQQEFSIWFTDQKEKASIRSFI